MKRPAEFDAKVVAYLPALRRHAPRFAIGDHDDFVNDVVAAALTRWEQYRPDGGFYKWLIYTMRDVARLQRVKGRLTIVDGARLDRLSVPPVQEDRVAINQVLARMTDRQAGVVVAIGKGYTLHEIAATQGCTKQRIAEIAADGYGRLRWPLRAAA